MAAFAGPNLARWTVDLFEPVTYAGSYAANIVLYGLSVVILARVTIPPSPASSHPSGGVGFGTIITQGRFLVAAASAMIGYGVMNLVMTATPLAMAKHGFGFGETTIVIQWHVLAMFAPSFVTGHIIKRFGIMNVIMTGALLQLACVFVNLYGQAEWNFIVALVLLGLGWNFLFVGATTVLTNHYSGPEKARAQGLNDFLVFGMVAVTALSSGALHHAYGWALLNMAMIPFIIAALACGLWLRTST
ncbi:MAG: MFS transporter [Gammaproteobacteria bacterium]|nr:MFS transporter [Gammaproteobacteria bacterium]